LYSRPEDLKAWKLKELLILIISIKQLQTSTIINVRLKNLMKQISLLISKKLQEAPQMRTLEDMSDLAEELSQRLVFLDLFSNSSSGKIMLAMDLMLMRFSSVKTLLSLKSSLQVYKRKVQKIRFQPLYLSSNQNLELKMER
jgi:hypothetical protein